MNNKPRLYEPLPANHPAVQSEDQRCFVCNQGFFKGQVTTLFELPPEDPEEIEKKAQGRPYMTKGELVHAMCYVKRFGEHWRRNG